MLVVLLVTIKFNSYLHFKRKRFIIFKNVAHIFIKNIYRR